MQEKKVSLQELSDVACRFLLRHYREPEDGFHCDVLIAAFDGAYAPGSDGDDDAVYMTAMLRAALSAWGPLVLILDLESLDYNWGDGMESFLRAGEEYRPWPGGLVIRVVASSRNEGGLRSIIDSFGDDPGSWLCATREAAIASAVESWRKQHP